MDFKVPQRPPMDSSEYKKYHESFMQNNHGSTAIHTFFCIFFTVQCTLYCAVKNRKSESIQYIYEYIVIILPLILGHTTLAPYIYVLNLTAFAFLLIEYLKFSHMLNIGETLKDFNVFRYKNIKTISCLRGLTYLITVFCILAVDFKLFPRYLAKTEKYGFSLMDTGVGLFVLMSGLVHKNLKKHTTVAIIKSNTKFVMVLLLLGIARFVSVKQLDYHEHVTEYGVHWNFFFTLAFCKVIATILLFFFNESLILSVILLIFHEFVLYLGLQNWVFSDSPRIDLISANREGISSCLGYVSLYLFAAYIKTELHNRKVTRLSVFKNLVSLSVLLWSVLSFTNVYSPASRTLANSSYCIYLSALFTTITSIMYIFEVVLQDKGLNIEFNVPLILSAVNENGLTYFLAANLLTGAVNLTIHTLFTLNIVAFLILNVYMILTSILVIYLRKLGVRV